MNKKELDNFLDDPEHPERRKRFSNAYKLWKKAGSHDTDNNVYAWIVNFLRHHTDFGFEAVTKGNAAEGYSCTILIGDEIPMVTGTKQKTKIEAQKDAAESLINRIKEEMKNPDPEQLSFLDQVMLTNIFLLEWENSTPEERQKALMAALSFDHAIFLNFIKSLEYMQLIPRAEALAITFDQEDDLFKLNSLVFHCTYGLTAGLYGKWVPNPNDPEQEPISLIESMYRYALKNSERLSLEQKFFIQLTFLEMDLAAALKGKSAAEYLISDFLQTLGEFQKLSQDAEKTEIFTARRERIRLSMSTIQMLAFKFEKEIEEDKVVSENFTLLQNAFDILSDLANIPQFRDYDPSNEEQRVNHYHPDSFDNPRDAIAYMFNSDREAYLASLSVLEAGEDPKTFGPWKGHLLDPVGSRKVPKQNMR